MSHLHGYIDYVTLKRSVSAGSMLHMKFRMSAAKQQLDVACSS